MFNSNKASGPSAQAGQVSRLLLLLAVIILVAAIITFLVMKMAEKPPQPVEPVSPSAPLPIYEKQLGNIDFVFESAIDRGQDLKAADVTDKKSTSAKDLPIDNPGAKFIQVTIGAKNNGTVNTDSRAWDIENIVDSQGRNFVPLEGTVEPWLPVPNLCGALLKPAFDPTPCTKIYEVSEESTGLKIRVETGPNNASVSGDITKMNTYLIDLIVK